jgi:hypothetical protein
MHAPLSQRRQAAHLVWLAHAELQGLTGGQQLHAMQREVPAVQHQLAGTVHSSLNMQLQQRKGRRRQG